jgi:hypothetical protein
MSDPIVHPAYGVGTVVSVRVEEDGRRVALCRFDDPPGQAFGSGGVRPYAEVQLEAEGGGQEGRHE